MLQYAGLGTRTEPGSHGIRHRSATQRNRHRPRCDQSVRAGRRGARRDASADLRPRDGRRSEPARRLEEPAVRQGRGVPRTVHDVRVHRGRHVEDRHDERRVDPAAAANRARRQTGGRSRDFVERPFPSRRRHRLEHRRIRGAERRLQHARRAAGRAGRPAAQAVGRRQPDVRAASSTRSLRRASTRARRRRFRSGSAAARRRC